MDSSASHFIVSFSPSYTQCAAQCGLTRVCALYVSSLAKEYQDAQWYFFAGEETQVNFEHLRAVLKRYDSSQASV